MIVIRYPPPQFRTKEERGKRYLFDAIRKVWLVLTEEEWVRQNFVHYLISELHYPVAMIALEKGFMLHGLKKRFDVLIYNSNHQPWMLIECKAPAVLLTEDVLQQVLRYNMSIPVAYMVITNGNTTIGWGKGKSVLELISEMPGWC